MLRSISESMKGLPLGRSFFKLAQDILESESGSTFKSSTRSSSTSGSLCKFPSTTRTDSSFSNDATLASSMRNHDTQPLHYKAKKQYKPMQSAALKSDVKQHKRMSTMKDNRILRPDRTSVVSSTKRSISIK